MKAQVCISFNGCKEIADSLGKVIGGDLCDLLITSYDRFGIHAELTTTVDFNNELEAEGWAADYAEIVLMQAIESLHGRHYHALLDTSVLGVELTA